MGAEHERRPRGHVVDVVDEDHPLGAESVHHVPVVHDLVVAVDGRLEDTHHPGQRLDGLLHPGTEAPGLGQEDPLHVGHGFNATGTPKGFLAVAALALEEPTPRWMAQALPLALRPPPGPSDA